MGRCMVDQKAFQGIFGRKCNFRMKIMRHLMKFGYFRCVSIIRNMTRKIHRWQVDFVRVNNSDLFPVINIQRNFKYEF